jgi:hypothetical protein
VYVFLEFVAAGHQPVLRVPQVVAHPREFGDHGVRCVTLGCLDTGFELFDPLLSASCTVPPVGARALAISRSRRLGT